MEMGAARPFQGNRITCAVVTNADAAVTFADLLLAQTTKPWGSLTKWRAYFNIEFSGVMNCQISLTSGSDFSIRNNGVSYPVLADREKTLTVENLANFTVLGTDVYILIQH